jgi:SAM-dependent methyltransferase
LETPEIFAYVKCKNCKSLALVNPPVDSQLGLYYPTDYAPYVVKLESLGTIGFPKQILSRLISGPRSDINILDYGCGNGTWLAQAANTFEGAKLHAVDFNPSEAISRIHWIGKDVNVISPQDFLLSHQIYDVINFGHSIEHVPDPIEVVKGAALRLSRHGLLNIACPVSDSLSLSLFGSFWQGLEAPRHFSIPSINALNSALRSAALSIVESESYGSPIVYRRSLNYAMQNACKFSLTSKLLDAVAKQAFVSQIVCHFKCSSKYRVLAQRA